jgi:CRP-like cAMP-binding protein
MRPRNESSLGQLSSDRLRRLGFFREFSLGDVQQLARVGTVSGVADGEFLATEGTRKQRRVLYVLLRGQLHYVKRIRGEHAGVVLRLRPGEVGGFLTFFNDDPSPVSVRSVGRSLVFEIGRREFQALMAEQPSLAVKVLVTLLRETIGRVDVLLRQAAVTAAWVLDLDRHVRAFPLTEQV